jgi:hypothetical protein
LRLALGKNVRPYLRNTAKKGRDVTEMVEHLSSRWKALNSNPGTTEKPSVQLLLALLGDQGFGTHGSTE